MTKFQCKISDLEAICKLVSLKGKSQIGKEFRAITDMVVNVIDGKLKIAALDALKSLAIRLEYNTDVQEEGQIPIGDIELFEKFLSRFNSEDDVIVSTSGNKIIIERDKPRKTAKIPMAALEAITSRGGDKLIDALTRTEHGFYLRKDKINYNLKLVFNSEIMADVIEDGEVVKQRIYPWVVSNGKLSVSIGSENYGEFSTEVALESLESDPENSGKQETKTAFANCIDNLFGNISGKVSVYIADETTACPLLLEQQTEKYSLFAILAPFVIRE